VPAGPGGPAPGRAGAGAATEGLGGTQVEGVRAVEELLVARRRRVREVWLAEGPSAAGARIARLAREAGVVVRTVSRDRLVAEARTEAPQGVLARADPVPAVDLDELWAPAGPERAALVVACDGITDPHNLGAVLRTAECAGATGAVLARHRAVHLSPAATKAAAGAVEHLPLALAGGIPAALARAREAGLWLVGLAADGDRSIDDLGPGGLDLAGTGLVVVLGSEGRGLSRLARQRCDVVVAIPLAGALPSLNVGAAAAVALFSIARARALGPSPGRRAGRDDRGDVKEG